MTILDLTQFHDDGFTVVLGGPVGFIEANSLADIIKGLTAPLTAINAIADPDFDVEVGIPDVSVGSINFRVTLRKHFRGIVAGSAVTFAVTQTVPMPKDIIGNIFASYLWDKYNKPATPCTHTLTADNKMLIQGDGCNVVIDPAVFELMQRVRKDKPVNRAARRFIRAVRKNPSVTSISVAQRPGAEEAGVATVVTIPPTEFATAAYYRLDDIAQQLPYGNALAHPRAWAAKTDDEVRRHVVRTRLTVVRRARTEGHWIFTWHGVRITAAVHDPGFGTRFRTGSTLRRRQEIDAELTITQHYLAAADVWVNESYEVMRVHAVREHDATSGHDFTTDFGDTGTGQSGRQGDEWV